MNAIMQDLTGSVYHTSDQHVDTLGSRILRDSKDLPKLLKFLEPFQPFNGGQELMNIVTGVNASPEVNVDEAKDVGLHILQGMVGKPVETFVLKRRDKVVTLAAKSAPKLDGEPVEIDQIYCSSD